MVLFGDKVQTRDKKSRWLVRKLSDLQGSETDKRTSGGAFRQPESKRSEVRPGKRERPMLLLQCDEIRRAVPVRQGDRPAVRSGESGRITRQKARNAQIYHTRTGRDNPRSQRGDKRV